MKRLITFLALSSLLVGNLAFAISDDGVNSLGVYFDAGVWDSNCTEITASVPFDVYFVMANCTQASIGGFEFGWAFVDDPVGQYFILATILPAGALNIGTANNLIVGLGVPLETAEATPMVQFQILPLVQLPLTAITVGPATPSSIPGRAVFNDGDDPALLMPMEFATVDGVDVIINPEGWVEPGIGSLGCPGPVATEGATWSNLKALYR